ncbi:MAG: GIY-YIG nuclease family protein [Sphingobacteriales bacterium]
MHEQIEKLNSMLIQLLSGNIYSFDDVKKMKDVMGVYIIYSQDGGILYIGSTNKFHIRFGIDLKHESTHTLVRKLIKGGIHQNRLEAVNHFLNHYKYRIHQCESKREAEALEHIAIWILNPKHNNYYLSPILH